jgi:hypothetical protein
MVLTVKARCNAHDLRNVQSSRAKEYENDEGIQVVFLCVYVVMGQGFQMSFRLNGSPHRRRLI